MCAGDVLVGCDVSDKWRVEGIVRWTGGRVGACARLMGVLADACQCRAVGMYVRSCLERCFSCEVLICAYLDRRATVGQIVAYSQGRAKTKSRRGIALTCKTSYGSS